MIERLIKLKLPILAVLDASARKQDHQLLLKDFQWKLGADMVTALRPYEIVTTVFSGEQYPTLSGSCQLSQDRRKVSVLQGASVVLQLVGFFALT